MADNQEGPKRGQRFQTLEELGASPREIMPALPGPHDDSRFAQLKDVRHDVGAKTAEIRAIAPPDEVPLKLPMKSSLVPTLIAFGILLFVAAMIALSR